VAACSTPSLQQPLPASGHRSGHPAQPIDFIEQLLENNSLEQRNACHYACGMQDRFLIERIEARILDIPTIRPHKLSFGAISRQSPVIVQLWLRNGATGFGEAATIGGPSWNEESPESIHHAITNPRRPA
jgi:hypothetical protein